MKPAYCYDQNTGAFSGETVAHPSPLEPGKHLLPANATFDVPPRPGSHEAAAFRNGGWTIVPDWRDVEIFSIETGEPKKIEQIGIAPDDVGATDKPRPSPAYRWKKGKWVEDASAKTALLNEARELCRAAIKAERDRRKSGGVFCGEKWFHSDANSRIQHLQLKDAARDHLEAGGNLDDVLVFSGESDPISWKTMDGSFVPMTARLAIKLVQLDRGLNAALFAIGEAHIAVMMEADDPSKHDFSDGWPPAFEI